MDKLFLLLCIVHTIVPPVLGQRSCKGICKWKNCNNNCIKEAKCVWNSGSCKVLGQPKCTTPCRSKVCQGCELPSACDGKLLDVAVVGAGVSGMYSAFKLSQTYDWSIHVFDANNRIGGRTFSKAMPGVNDFKADFGAMRFCERCHPRLFKLSQELGLTIQPFTNPTQDESLFYLRDHVLDKNDIANGNVPYTMTDDERKLSRNLGALFAYWNRQVISNDSRGLEDSWSKVCVDGKLVFEKGNYNAWLEVTSKDVIDYVAARIVFKSVVISNSNYVNWCQTEYTPSQGRPSTPLLTFREGFQEITLEMARRFTRKTKNQVFLNHELQSVSHDGNIGILQFFNKVSSQTVNVCAREVIIGVTAESLKHINFMDDDVSQKISELLPSVIRQPATKSYLVYDTPWWRHLGKGPVFRKLRNKGIDLKSVATDLPLGQILDIGVDNTTGNAMLLIYNDWWDNIHFWAPYMLNGTQHSSGVSSEFIATEKLITQFHIQFAKVFNVRVEDIPMPISSAAHAWYDTPYQTGWHLKSPGFHFPTVKKLILKPVRDKGVYIVGETFSDHQSWVEGALQTTQEVLSTHFSLTF